MGAIKCNVCGNYYTEYPSIKVKGVEYEILGIELDIDSDDSIVDLCPTCVKKLENFLGGGDFETK